MQYHKRPSREEARIHKQKKKKKVGMKKKPPKMKWNLHDSADMNVSNKSLRFSCCSADTFPPSQTTKAFNPFVIHSFSIFMLYMYRWMSMASDIVRREKKSTKVDNNNNTAEKKGRILGINDTKHHHTHPSLKCVRKNSKVVFYVKSLFLLLSNFFSSKYVQNFFFFSSLSS